MRNIWSSHHEQLLSDALHADRRADYEEVTRGFDNFLKMTRLGWKVEDWPPPESAKLYEQLEQDYRIALMGLGGRAVILARHRPDCGRGPVLGSVAGRSTISPQQLADDIAVALTHEDRRNLCRSGQTGRGRAPSPSKCGSVDSARYPLTFFSVRLLELATGPMRDLDLTWNCAKQVARLVCGELRGSRTRCTRLTRAGALERSGGTRRSGHCVMPCAGTKWPRMRTSSGANSAAEKIAALTADVYASAFTTDIIETALCSCRRFQLYLPGRRRRRSPTDAVRAAL